MVSFEINFGGLVGGQRISRRRIETAFDNVCKILKMKDKKNVSIAFVDKKTMKYLNEAYHGGNGVTDVLSFPSSGLQHARGYLGEIVIFYDRAKEQALKRDVAVVCEVELLLVHGLLHLLGHDHDNAASASRMFRLQDRILEK